MTTELYLILMLGAIYVFLHRILVALQEIRDVLKSNGRKEK